MGCSCDAFHTSGHCAFADSVLLLLFIVSCRESVVAFVLLI